MAESEKNQSIERAIAVLRIVSEARAEPNLSEIMAASGLGKTIVLRILSTLVGERMLERMPETGRYRLGSGLIGMAHLALARHPLLGWASGLLDAIVKETEDIGLMMAAQGSSAICIRRLEGTAQIATVGTRIGTRSPLHLGGGPMAILCFSPDDVIDEYLSGPLERRTARSVIDPVSIRERIAEGRERGYVIGNEDLYEYVVAIGIPVFDTDRRLLGSLSIGNINHRYPPERCAEIGERFVELSRTMLG
ncbi:IclR family transcriptional regulator [Roseovarius indicus]|uniref:IclR family transcriptional regulator n=1 Tax=Roseovarius indicus TaxID=540747 RepID=UPI00405977D3